ncbi:MAG: exopolysaccharide biosynthesis polyprenyl glycosylphosphotransferase [Alphaproteobacteria bacterium]|nr:exopolysaccharide biosynthesis polyprenyl glycosylphosphotransferase [Alphaproteobacteria bacterium]
MGGPGRTGCPRCRDGESKMSLLAAAAALFDALMLAGRARRRAVAVSAPPMRRAARWPRADAPLLRREATEDRFDGGAIGPGVYRDAFVARRPYAGKRVLDIAAAATLLIICAPLMAIAAVAVRLDSPGPIFFRQKRIGFQGKPFYILKFRSMVVDAEKNGPQWASKDDGRVTRVGRIMRKLHIDEIPQALNVLRGDMSFVGPRPEQPEFVRLLEREIPNYHLRHIVKPGITGWAQIKYVYTASVEDARIKQYFDLDYVKNVSLRRDLHIMLSTVPVALFGLGSR